MTTKPLQDRLRALVCGFEEWRVENPEDGSYCMSYTRDDDLSPEHAAREWLADHVKRHPDSQFAGYVVKHHHVFTQKDRALMEAADALQALEAENARITECGRAHIRRAAALEAERDELRADSFEAVINHLCATLPDDGSTITIHLEHWAGTLTATDWDGNEMAEEADEDTFLSRVRHAAKWLDEQQSTARQGLEGKG